MTQLKKHIAYTFLAVFVCTAIIGIFGAIGVISIPATPLVTIFAFLAAQCITVIAAIIKAPNYFDDPLVVTELKERRRRVAAASCPRTPRSFKATSNRSGDNSRTSRKNKTTHGSKRSSYYNLSQRKAELGEPNAIFGKSNSKEIYCAISSWKRTNTHVITRAWRKEGVVHVGFVIREKCASFPSQRLAKKIPSS